MRAVIQRTSRSSVVIGGVCHGEIGTGLNILIGITEGDSDEDIDWLCHKIVNLRVFDDADGVMNRSVLDSYIKAAKPEISVPLYEKFLERLENILGKPVKKGIFGADMKVSIVNDGPVTIIIDTKNRE